MNFSAAARDAVGEEPTAAGGRQNIKTSPDGIGSDDENILPPPMTPLVEEPNGMGGR